MIKIREAQVSDISVIAQLAARIWPVCYQSVISEAQINYMLTMMYSSSSLQEQMVEKGHQFLLASYHDHTIPDAFASYSQKTPENQNRYRLHKLYVDTNFQKNGIGNALIQEIIRIIRPKKGTELELNVNKRNPALNFYLHLGFTIEREEIIDIGNGFIMDDYVMVLNLN